MNKTFVELNKKKILNLLRSVKREGMDDLCDFLEEEGFFRAPASTKYHNNFLGGLAAHSLSVYLIMKIFKDNEIMDLNDESIIIVGLLHDLCKYDVYAFSGKFIDTVKTNDNRHSMKSIDLIKQFIDLRDIEEQCIKYHMGHFGIIADGNYFGEYEKQEYFDAQNNINILGTHCADNMESKQRK